MPNHQDKLRYFKMVLTLLILSAFLYSCQEKLDQTQFQSDLNRGLIASWSFDNDLNNIILDNSDNKITGMGYSITFEKGIVGQAAVFNGTDSRILFPSLNSQPPLVISNLQVGSIALWFKYKSLGAQILPILYFGESQTGTTHNSLIIEIGHGGGTNFSNKRLYFTIVNQGFCFDSSINLIENKWYHFVAVVGEDGNTGYLNSIEMTERKYNLGSNKSFSDFFYDVPVKKLLSLGYGRYGQEDPFYTFNGSIDEVRIYDRPLNSNEIKELYEQGD